jgi:non-ribosomal peptide synthetase component F
MTPSLVRTLNPKDVPSLKHLVVGGEPIGRDLESVWAGYVHFIHLYGGRYKTTSMLTNDTDLSNAASEGGFMIKETSNPKYQGKGLFPVGGLSWLVDPQDVNKLVPIGAVGEIIFESHELTAGYLNDAEKTAKTFISPPIWAQKRHAATGCRYLRMGDLGRYETDGSISIYGRADTQVKVCGPQYVHSVSSLIINCRFMDSGLNYKILSLTSVSFCHQDLKLLWSWSNPLTHPIDLS